MNYIGKLVTGVKDFYQDINTTNLTGSIDVVVIEQPDRTTLNATPFHVKFGKMGIIRPKERTVEICVNNEVVHLNMRLGKAGVAYFWREDQDCTCVDCLSTISTTNKDNTTNNKNESLASVNNQTTNVSGLVNVAHSVHDEPLLSDSSFIDGQKIPQQWDWGELPLTVTLSPDINNSSVLLKKAESVIIDDKLLNESNNNMKVEIKNEIKSDGGLPNFNEFHNYLHSVDLLKMFNDLNLSFSLCGNLKSSKKRPANFSQCILSFEMLQQNPYILFDNNIVVKVKNRYYTWLSALPQIFSVLLFNKELIGSTLKKIRIKEKTIRTKKTENVLLNNLIVVKDKDKDKDHQTKNKKPSSSKKESRWFYWSKNKDGNNDNLSETSSDGEPNELNNSSCSASSISSVEFENSFNEEPNFELIELVDSSPSCNKKAVKLNSAELNKLNLKYGANKISFSVTSRLQGTVTITSMIYKWHHNDKIVVSDIDGTITKSDMLGHMLPLVGRDWTQEGVTRFLNKLQQNGYRIVYLSSRTIGISDITRAFLKKVHKDDSGLPDGPVLLSPNSLFKAIHTEIIEKKPERFKIACLNNLKKLFPKGTNPFYAGFGNRTNDATAYTAVGIDPIRVFIINHNGQIRQEYNKLKTWTYFSLADLCDEVFPVVGEGLMKIVDVSLGGGSGSRSPSHVNLATNNNNMNSKDDTVYYNDTIFWSFPYEIHKTSEEVSKDKRK